MVQMIKEIIKTSETTYSIDVNLTETLKILLDPRSSTSSIRARTVWTKFIDFFFGKAIDSIIGKYDLIESGVGIITN